MAMSRYEKQKPAAIQPVLTRVGGCRSSCMLYPASAFVCCSRLSVRNCIANLCQPQVVREPQVCGSAGNWTTVRAIESPYVYNSRQRRKLAAKQAERCALLTPSMLRSQDSCKPNPELMSALRRLVMCTRRHHKMTNSSQGRASSIEGYTPA